jgi:MGT family glycosyltransferase
VKILIASSPIMGHVNPMLSIARMFLANGHNVVFQTGSVYREHVEHNGIPFRSLLGSADFDARDVDAAFPERKHLKPGPEMVRFDMERIFIDPIRPQYEGLCALLKDWQADAVFADTTFFGTLPMLLGAAPRRPVVVHCGISCLFTERDDGAPPVLGLPPATTAAQREEYAAIYKQVDEAMFTPTRRYLDHRLAELGARPLPGLILSSTARLADLYLQPTVPSFEYPSSLRPAGVRFVGALPLARSNTPPPDWAGELDGTKRVVLVTQGTVANHDLGQVIVPTLEALADMPDVLVVATTGGRPVADIPGPIPANARVATFLPYDWLLPKVDVVVTNGGYGTVSLALQHGIPLVAAGLTEDKAEVSARVAWSGVGVNLATNTATAEAVRQAVRDVLDKPQYRERAKALKGEFAQYDAAPAIIRLVSEAVAAAAERADAD